MKRYHANHTCTTLFTSDASPQKKSQFPIIFLWMHIRFRNIPSRHLNRLSRREIPKTKSSRSRTPYQDLAPPIFSCSASLFPVPSRCFLLSLGPFRPALDLYGRSTATPRPAPLNFAETLFPFCPQFELPIIPFEYHVD